MIVVSDASPLIVLAKINRLELLRILYKRVMVPAEVYQEVVIPDAKLPGSTAIAQASWLDIQPPLDAASLTPRNRGSPFRAANWRPFYWLRSSKPTWFFWMSAVVVGWRLAAA